jgi:hypothetical protein
LESGKDVTFTVTLVPEKMRRRAIYRGAFLIRLANGYSRPVMVYAETDVTPPARPAQADVFVEYLEAESPSSAQDHARVSDAQASGGACCLLSRDKTRAPAEYRFRVPQAGKYFVLLRVRSEEPVNSHDSVRFALDDGSLYEATLLSSTSWQWSLAAHNREQRLSRLQAFDLGAGEHILKLAPQDSIYVDLVAITDNPAMFD